MKRKQKDIRFFKLNSKYERKQKNIRFFKLNSKYEKETEEHQILQVKFKI